MTRIYLVTNIKSKAYAELVTDALLSWYYVRDDIQYFINNGHKIFLDCGAYTFQSAGGGKAPDIEDYAQFCHKFGKDLDAYANMDVIGSSERTYENQMIMEDFGLTPVPVFHRGSEWDHLIRYLEGDYDYIALGGVADPRERVESSRWMGRVISLIAKHNPEIKTHAFGVTSLEPLLKYRFYSADSSTWTGALRYNKFQKYTGNGNVQEICVEDTKEAIGLHFGDSPLEGKIKHSLIEWLHMVNWCTRIIPSSEEPFKKSEIDALTI